MKNLPKINCKEGKQEAWDEYVRLNQDPYGGAVIEFAAKWASLMEIALAEGGSSVEAVAGQCEDEAVKDSGLTGFMYGCAVSLLTEVWYRGEELGTWHNSRYMPSKEAADAASEGKTVNPALVNIAL